MREIKRGTWIAIASLAAALAGCGARPQAAPAADPVRIVTMAPSLTETLLALDLGDRIVGSTRYCPPVPGAVSIGGYFDPSYEAILALEPDLVIVMQSHDELNRRVGDLGLSTLRVDQHDVEGILTSIEIIAERCGVRQRGLDLASSLRAELEDIAARVADRERPTTLVVVGRQPGGGGIGSLWAAAGDTFYDDVLDFAGGVNAIADGGIRYPEFSREGLLAVDPDVILDVLADGGAREVTAAEAAADWNAVSDLRAVREGRVHILVEDFVVIPGPRIVDTVKRVAELLHPEVEWP